MIEVVDFADYIRAFPNTRMHQVILAEAETALPRPPDFTSGPISSSIGEYLRNRPACPSLELYVLRNVQVGPDGLVCADGRMLSSWRFNLPSDHVAGLAGRVRTASLRLKRIDGRVVLLAGPGWQVYGHWLVDLLPRIHLLSKAGFGIGEMRFLLPSGVPAFVHSLLACFGIAPHQLVTWDEDRELAAPDELIVATNLREQDRFHTEMAHACSTLLGRTRQRLGNEGHRRLFVSRGDSARSLINRQQLEGAATARGYMVVRPEDLSISQQVEMFRGADRVAGEYGSGLHGLMFSRPGTRVLAIRGTSRYPGLVQSGLSEVLHQPIGYVFGETAFAALDQPYAVSERDFQTGLDWLDG